MRGSKGVYGWTKQKCAVLLRDAFPWGKVAALKGGRMRGGRDLWFAPTKAFSLGRRCHAFWRDGCGVYRLSGRCNKTYLVPSTPVTAYAVPPSPAGEGFGMHFRRGERLPLEGKLAAL